VGTQNHPNGGFYYQRRFNKMAASHPWFMGFTATPYSGYGYKRWYYGVNKGFETSPKTVPTRHDLGSIHILIAT
jgi:hypothetical protein